MTGAYPTQEPPPGSVVAIDWGGPHQEVWTASKANLGNWYTADIPLPGGWHPVWRDVLHRAEGRALTLLAAAGRDSYAAGYRAGTDAAAAALQEALSGLAPPGHSPAPDSTASRAAGERAALPGPGSSAPVGLQATADPAGLPADAMRALHSRLLAAVPPAQRGQAEDWIADLLDLATGNLSPHARAEIRQALAGSREDPGTERDWEVSLGTRTVTASDPRQAAARARREWLEETDYPFYEPGPNDAYEVRPAHRRGPWQVVRPGQPPARTRPHQQGPELG